MTCKTICDRPGCGADIPEDGPYYRLEKITPEWADHADWDLCSLACLAAWAAAQQDLNPEPVDRAGATVPADVWAETVKRMD